MSGSAAAGTGSSGLPPGRRIPRLLAISDRRRMGPDPARAVLTLAASGLPGFQWREKDLSPAESFLFLEAIVDGMRRKSLETAVLVNDRADLALALRIGVHLPSDGIPTRAARALLGPEGLIGRSTHSRDETLRARDEGADYAVFGPIYDTASKRAYGAPQGPDVLAAVTAAVGPFPVLAVGGISPDRALECLNAGACGVAAIGGIWEAPEPVAALRSYLAVLLGTPSPQTG